MNACSLELPRPDRSIETVILGATPYAGIASASPPESRRVFAAAHVAADALASGDPTTDALVDWDATLAFRRHLWSLGLGVAEAMDTAQRGMGMTWSATQELIRRSIAEADSCNGTVICGVGTDQLADGVPHDRGAVVSAYEEQLGFVEGLGGRAVLMASRALATSARSPDDYLEVYGRLLEQVGRPVVLHWLGEMFDPELAGYWGSADPHEALEIVVRLCSEHTDAVDGVKISLLDDALEITLRRRLPEGVRCYTGDDFGYPHLIRGDDQGYSDALLGIFDPIAPVAAAAFQALDVGDLDLYDALLAPTLPLARHLFAAPTYHYKVGVVFLAYLAGHQNHFRMVGGKESGRSVQHLADLVRLADAAGVLPDPELAAARAQPVFAVAGLGAAPVRSPATVTRK